MRERVRLWTSYRDRASLLNRGYRRLMPLFHRQPACIDLMTPIVSFTFDDFPVSAFSRGADILERFGGRGTYYVCLDPGLSGRREFCGARKEVLTALVMRGHEIGCHTYTHADCSRHGIDSVLANIHRNSEALGRVLPGYRLSHFAYPFGSVSVCAKDIVRNNFVSGRGIVSGVNVGSVDLTLLRAHQLTETPSSLAHARKLIERNRRLNGWLIFFTHDVSPDPGPYGISPDSLCQIVELAISSGARLATVGQAVVLSIRQ